ncbi:hypothetical protein [Ferriphaselus sp. R-1]|uniref:hypothetical protein n=1 Tax=Ferriphaselus sp. R-1 TaxID=1485544 RepID=UPI0012685473|nr:hypothetical protein [Ferriphaselus sp. R-1]
MAIVRMDMGSYEVERGAGSPCDPRPCEMITGRSLLLRQAESIEFYGSLPSSMVGVDVESFLRRMSPHQD